MMKKTLSLLVVLTLLVSAVFVLSVSAAAAAPGDITWTPASGDAVNLSTAGTAEDGKVTYKDGVVTLDGSNGELKGKALTWKQAGDVTVVVKGAVTLSGAAYHALGNSSNDTVSNLTVELVGGATLNASVTNSYALINQRGVMTFKGEGTVNATSKNAPCICVGSNGNAGIEQTNGLTVEGSVTVHATSTDQWHAMVSRTTAATNITLKDSAKLILEAAKGEVYKNIGKANIVMSDNAQLTIFANGATAATERIFSNTVAGVESVAVSLTAGNDNTKLVAKIGATEKDATEKAWDEASPMGYFGYVQVTASMIKQPTTDDPSSSTTSDTSTNTNPSASDSNTGSSDSGNAGTSDASLWVVVAAVAAVAGIAGVAALTLRKKDLSK